jgi:SOS regulatory protein LexA
MGITSKQKHVLNFITSYIHKHGHAPTQREILERFELKSFGSVQRYLKYLIDAGMLVKGWNARQGIELVNQPEPSVDIPLLGTTAAGKPIEAIESSETIAVPLSMLPRRNGRFFALNVQGRSMIEDGIMDGDVIIVREQKTAENGQTVVAIVDGAATVKHFYRTRNRIELRPANSTMKPIFVTEGDFALRGIVIGLLRKF